MKFCRDLGLANSQDTFEFGAKGFKGGFVILSKVFWLRKQRNGIEYRIYEKFVLAAA